MTGPRDIARMLLDIGAVNLRPEQPFRLTSGKPSPVYVDCRRVISFVAERRAIVAAAVARIDAFAGKRRLFADRGFVRDFKPSNIVGVYMPYMVVDGNGRVRIEYRVPARGLIGFQGEFMTMTRGTGLASHIFDGYGIVKGEIPERHNGVLVSNEQGEAVA